MLLKIESREMKGKMSTETAATLRLANTSLRAWLVRLRAEPVALTQVQASDLQELLAELLRTSGCLRTGSAGAAAGTELEVEIAEYRTNLESLAKVLPSVQGRLLAERARIQIEQSHIAARKAWAQASRRTL
jgi:hypothetical protein